MSSIVILGTGNSAYAFAKAISNTDLKLAGVWGRDAEKTQLFANQFACAAFNSFHEIESSADILLLAVKDNAIDELAEKIKTDKLVLHCSGMQSINILKQENIGVIWPLQSIKKDSFLDFKNTPICIEANSENNLTILKSFANSLSQSVHLVNSAQREYLHLAAVLTNNFSNHLLALAKNICDEQNLNFEILKPIIHQTIENAFAQHPKLNQTGPAIRKDSETMNKHLQLLENNKQLKNLYELMSKSIIDMK